MLVEVFLWKASCSHNSPPSGEVRPCIASPRELDTSPPLPVPELWHAVSTQRLDQPISHATRRVNKTVSHATRRDYGLHGTLKCGPLKTGKQKRESVFLSQQRKKKIKPFHRDSDRVFSSPSSLSETLDSTSVSNAC